MGICTNYFVQSVTKFLIFNYIISRNWSLALINHNVLCLLRLAVALIKDPTICMKHFDPRLLPKESDIMA